VCILFRRHEIVDRDELKVAALGFRRSAQHVSADAPETRNSNPHGHRCLLSNTEYFSSDTLLLCADCGAINWTQGYRVNAALALRRARGRTVFFERVIKNSVGVARI
jgi:hypothetical protein